MNYSRRDECNHIFDHIGIWLLGVLLLFCAFQFGRYYENQYLLDHPDSPTVKHIKGESLCLN